MPGFTFPAVGPVGLGSPPFRSAHSRAPSVLRSAKTAAVPSRVASRHARFPVPCHAPFFLHSHAEGSFPQATGRLVSRADLLPRQLGKENDGSPKFPSYPGEYMPRSKTPVVHEALAMARLTLLPSARWHGVGVPAHTGAVIPSVHDVLISGFNNAACILATPGSKPPVTRTHAGSLPACWLGSGRVGLELLLAPTG